MFSFNCNFMKTDSKIKIDVQDELSWEPSIDGTKIGVNVDNGDVTLTGTVDSYAMKMVAEMAARRVQGVKEVAENIEVEYCPPFKKTDTDIAKSRVNALNWYLYDDRSW